MSDTCKTPGTGGERYVPMEERTGEKSTVYFTRDLSAEGLCKLYQRVKAPISGKVAVKLHTGEAEGPNIIPRPWVKELLASELPPARFSKGIYLFPSLPGTGELKLILIPPVFRYTMLIMLILYMIR